MNTPFPVDGASLTGRERERFAARMFDSLAPKYVRLNRLISWGADERWRRPEKHYYLKSLLTLYISSLTCHTLTRTI